MNPLRWLRARRLARLEAEITAVYAEAWAVIAEQRDRDNATHDAERTCPIPTIR